VTAEQNAQPLSILIVDDDARVGRALARYLELEGHFAEVALTGAQGLERARSKPWHLLCLDAQLPDIPGPLLARQIQPLAPSAYTVLITGFASSFDDCGLLTECIDGVLPKPWKADELECVLQRAHDHIFRGPIV
jgi:DNA-binding response OmpR family regulator